jgi:hypothetical protein
VADPIESAGARLDDDVLKEAYRLAGTATDGPHLSEGQWEQLMCGELTEADRHDALGHIVSCSHCTRIHRSLLAISAEAAAFDEHVVGPGVVRPASRTWMYLGGLATAAAIVAAVVIDLRPARTGNAGEVIRSGAGTVAVELVAPLADAPLQERRLQWQPIATADAYEVRVNAADGGAVWQARVTTAEARLPREVSLAAGRYYWQVIAFREGVIQGTSAITAFRVE